MTCGHWVSLLYTVQTNTKADKIHQKINYRPITPYSENMLKWYGGHDIDTVYFERVAIIVEMEIEIWSLLPSIVTCVAQ